MAAAGADDADTFAAGSGTPALVDPAPDDPQILNQTRPAAPAAGIADDGAAAVAVDTVRMGTGLYAAVVSEDGLHILNLTHPAAPAPVAGIADAASVHLRGAQSVAALNLGSKAYAAVASDGGLQVVDITRPAAPVARVYEDGVHADLTGASAVDTFVMNGGAYAILATDDGIVAVDLADPAPVRAAQNNSTAALRDASAVKSFSVAGHVYAAAAVPDGGGAIRIVSLGEMDTVPPTLSSAIWAPANRTITLVFSEPLNHTATDYSRITVLGGSVNLTLADIASGTTTGRTIAAALSPAQGATLGVPETVRLSEGAVQDVSANPISPTDIAVTLADSVPPTVSAATFNPQTGLLTLSFSEPLNHAANIYHDMAIAGPVHEDAWRIVILLAFLYPDMAISGPFHLYALDEMPIRAASNMTIEATLEAAQAEAVGSAPMLYMMGGSVRDVSGNPIGAVRGLDVTVLADEPDTTPPALKSSSYNTGSGVLAITFSEPLNGTAIRYDRLHIRDAGQSAGGLTLDGVTSKTLDADSAMITLTLSGTQRQMINAMAAPQLDLEAGAVSDLAGIGAVAAPDRPIAVIDGVPPTVVSADYEPGTGVLVITFSEPLGPAIDYSEVSVAGLTGSVALDEVAARGHSGVTIAVTLDAAQRTAIGDAPILSVSAGAVSDTAGNPIRQVSNFRIVVEAAPVITAPVTTPPPARDTTPPRLLSSYYDTGTGALNMTFSEPLRSPVNYTGIILVGPSQNLTLGAVAVRNHIGSVINATLDGPQRTIVGDVPRLSIEAGSVSDRSGNRILQTDRTILVIDGIPPEFVLSHYNTGTGILNVTFNEPLEQASVGYALLHVREAGQAAGGLSLDDVAARTVDPSSTTVILTLSDAQRQTMGSVHNQTFNSGLL